MKEELQTIAERLAASEAAAGASGGGSRQRGLPEDLRMAFIDARASLFQRGIYDPMLARFDSASVQPASNAEIAERLRQIADSLG
jgi:hypothetical protein